MMRLCLHFLAFPEFRALFGEKNARRFEEMVERKVNDDSQEAKNCLAIGFRAMMESPAALVAKHLLSLRRRLQSGGNSDFLFLQTIESSLVWRHIYAVRIFTKGLTRV